MKRVTIGGDRLGAGKRMKVDLHGYERSTHDLGFAWRNTISAGTLVPFMSLPALPGDTFDINLGLSINTHPTVGPLFGSYKAQVDTFLCPIRLYQALLHNNKLGIGLTMGDVLLPQMSLFVDPAATIDPANPDNSQINPSCILSHLGIRGIGAVDPLEPAAVERTFNALPLLMYWDTVKNYYSNKQEPNGWVIHQERSTLVETIDTITINGTDLPEWPLESASLINLPNQPFVINYTGAEPQLNQIIINTNKGQYLAESVLTSVVNNPGLAINSIWNWARTGNIMVYSWNYISADDLPISTPIPVSFPLENLDTMREKVLSAVAAPGVAFSVNEANLEPYSLLLNWELPGFSPYLNTQEGLALKTYQSDLFNNWLNSEWIDGPTGINAITAIDTTGGSFTIDTLNLSKKVYEMLTRIAISGGTYDDWLETVYDHPIYNRPETPVYMGGLIKELVFQEVVSTADTETNSDGQNQPLGTLAGKGVMAQGHKGGQVTIKVNEPSYILGIISLTPRIDYSQGNNWDVNLTTMDDFHKPALDEIGFQDLPQEQMAWWTTSKTLAGTEWVQKSAGKQPAWIHYMTAVNRVLGNFAVPDNEMFMTLNRRYEHSGTNNDIVDLTTYIDPSKFNYIFAQTSIDAMNFWAQLSVDITARRKMSAKLMPNL